MATIIALVVVGLILNFWTIFVFEDDIKELNDTLRKVIKLGSLIPFSFTVFALVLIIRTLIYL